MNNSLSKVQKVCVYFGGLLFGLLDILCLVLAMRREPWRHPSEYYLAHAALFSCSLLPMIVAGCWIAAVLCRIWRSLPGKVLFATFCGGLLGSVAAVACASHWIVDQHEFLRVFAKTIIPAAILPIGAAVGLVTGYVLGRRARRLADKSVCTSTTDDLCTFGVTVLAPLLVMSRTAVAMFRRMGLRWSLLTLALVVLLGVASVALWPVWQRAAAENDLRGSLAATDELEPDGWRFEDLERQRQPIADAANSSKIISEAAELAQGIDLELLETSRMAHAPVLLREDQAAKMRHELAKVRPALKTARRLLNCPTGRFPAYRWMPDYFSTVLIPQVETRQVVLLLQADALIKCHEDNLQDASDTAIAMVYAGRALDDEPAALCQVARLYVQRTVVTTCERLLGHGELKAPALARMRHLLLEERRHPTTQLFIRAERAGQHHFYTNLELGAVDLATLTNKKDVWTDADERMWKNYVASGAAKRSHAFTLRTMNRFLDALKLPEPKALESVQELSQMARAGDFGEVPLLASVLMPAASKIAFTETLSKLRISCAIVGLAAESFRLEQKRWPRDIHELQKSGQLAEIPADPFYSFDPSELSKPLRLRHAEDGIVVHSIVAPRKYDGDTRDDLKALPFDDWENRNIAEFRLWNPAQRRQPGAVADD